VFATDVAQNAYPPTSPTLVTSVFIVDAVAPTTAITNPTNLAFFNATTVVSTLSGSSPNRMRGTATDDLSGVASVSSKLTRYYAGATTYWNGATWVGTDPGYILTPTLATSGP